MRYILIILAFLILSIFGYTQANTEQLNGTRLIILRLIGLYTNSSNGIAPPDKALKTSDGKYFKVNGGYFIVK
jgi:hypothetical protein